MIAGRIDTHHHLVPDFYARPEHVWAFTAALDQFNGIDHDAVNRHNAERFLT